MGCTMLLLPMGDGLYNVVQPMGHGNWVTHGPWVVQRFRELHFSHDPWVVQCFYSPWAMDCTTLYNPWVMETGLPMGHGLYNVVQPVSHGMSLYSLLL